MPRKTTRKPLVLDVPAPKTRRGRPRKIVAPEVLTPFGRQEDTVVEESESPEKDLKLETEKPNARRMNPATSERSYTPEEVEFMNALAEFKRASGRMFPTCCEILDVLRSLGYDKREMSVERSGTMDF